MPPLDRPTAAGARRKARGWGVAHPSWYIPRGNPREDVKLTLEERRLVADRIVGKPFVLMHDNEGERNRLGTVFAAFVDGDGTLHTGFEFDSGTFHSNLVKHKALRKQCHGLSLAVLASHSNGAVQRADLPVELTACPLKVARKGDACEMYWLDGNWLCEDSKRASYKRSLDRAGYEIGDATRENVSLEKALSAMARDETNTESRKQRRVDGDADEPMDEDPKQSKGGDGSSQGASVSEKLDELLEELNREREEKQALLREKDERTRAEREQKLKALEEDYQSMLESVETHLKMLVHEGFPQDRANGMLGMIKAASSERDQDARATRMSELRELMQLVQHSHSLVQKTQKEKETAEQSYKVLATELRSTKKDRQRVQQRLKAHEESRAARKQQYKDGGIASRVKTGEESGGGKKAGDEATPMDRTSTREKRRATRMTEYGDDDATDKKKKKASKIKVHTRVSTDIDVPPEQASSLAPRPVLTAAFMALKPTKGGATFGIPEITGGLKHKNPSMWHKILSTWQSTAPVGQPRNEFQNFAGRVWSGVDLEDGQRLAPSTAAPREPAPGELL